jgi:ZIP family zinc transporter
LRRRMRASRPAGIARARRRREFPPPWEGEGKGEGDFCGAAESEVNDFLRLLLGACTVLAATSLGAAGVFAFKRIEKHVFALIVAFCAGVMSFSALEMIDQAHAMAGYRVALAGLLLGTVSFLAVDKLLPHAHLALVGAELHDSKRKAALYVGTITIHNIPEGFAVASAFAGSPALGWLVTMSIALQDVPEGLIVSAPVASYGVASRHSFAWGVFSGLVEFAAAILGFLFLRAVSTITPWALGFSAGAMAYVVLSELLPDAMQAENRLVALGAAILGFAVAFGVGALIGF